MNPQDTQLNSAQRKAAFLEKLNAAKPKAQVDPLQKMEGSMRGQEAINRLKAYESALNAPEAPTRTLAGEILPIGGSILGAIGGGLAGSVAGPVGAFAGAVAGATAGGAAGEAGQQYIEKRAGDRKEFDVEEVKKTGVEMGLIEGIGGPLAGAAGKLLKGAGRLIGEFVIPTSIKEAKFLQAYKAGKPFLERVSTFLKGEAPTTVAKTAFDKGLMGTEAKIGVEANKAAKNLWKDLISPQLVKSEQKTNLPAFFSEAEQNIIKQNPELTRQKALLDALNSTREDYAGLEEISLDELQKLKEGWAKFVPEKAYKGENISGALNDVRNILSGQARNKIYTSLGGDVKQAYFDYGNLKSLQELGQKAMTKGKLKGGAGSFISGISDMALVPLGTFGGQTIYKVGEGLEFIGKPGARVLRDLLDIPLHLGQPITGQSETLPQTPQQ